MSWRDTLQGAREEFEATRSASPKSEKTAENEEQTSSGVMKRSVARAKPAREAASGVRVVAAGGGKTHKKAGSTTHLTKEQRKDIRRQENEARDRLVAASNIVLNKNEEYRRKRRLWWTLIIVGMLSTVVSFALMYVAPKGTSADFSTPWGKASLVMLVLAYAGIIAAFIYDYIRIRPLRDLADSRVRGMSAKKIDSIIKDDIAEQETKSRKEDRKKK